MALKKATTRVRSGSDEPDLDVSPSGGAFVLSIGPVVIALDRAKAEELVMLLEDALLRGRTAAFVGVSN